jgi:hypothetical protein
VQILILTNRCVCYKTCFNQRFTRAIGWKAGPLETAKNRQRQLLTPVQTIPSPTRSRQHLFVKALDQIGRKCRTSIKRGLFSATGEHSEQNEAFQEPRSRRSGAMAVLYCFRDRPDRQIHHRATLPGPAQVGPQTAAGLSQHRLLPVSGRLILARCGTGITRPGTPDSTSSIVVP